MTEKQWGEQYARLCKAFGRDFDKGQFEAYYGVLEQYPFAGVEAAVTTAITINTRFPKAAELVIGAVEYRRQHAAPAAICDVCQGTKFTVTFCDGKVIGGQPGDDHRPLLAVNPSAPYVCTRDFPHAKHEDAHFCPQCHPAARRSA